MEQIGLLGRLERYLWRDSTFPEFPQTLRRNPHRFRVQVVAEKTSSKPKCSYPDAP